MAVSQDAVVSFNPAEDPPPAPAEPGVVASEPREPSAVETAAATTLQSAHRGNMARKEAAALREPVVKARWWDPAEGGLHAGYDTVDPPWYPRPIPAVKFAVDREDSGRHVLVLFDAVALHVPAWFVYTFPVLLFGSLTLVWCVACRGMSRSGFSWRVPCEATMCFTCLWAELATKHVVLSASHAWGYVVALVLLVATWNACSVAWDDTPQVAYVFVVLFGLLWVAFSGQRALTRKAFRQRLDPLADNHLCADFAVSLCCAPMAAVQESQLLAAAQPPSLDGVVSARGTAGAPTKV